MQHEKNDALESLYKSIQTFGNLTEEAENRDKLYRYNDALMRSLCSILEDCECDQDTKMSYFLTTMRQYKEAMEELFLTLTIPSVKHPRDEPVNSAIGKSDDDRFDEIEEVVEKFNPYHDSRGRFSSADSYTSFTTRTKDPKKQHMADAAVAREKERGSASAPKKPSGPKDPETIGGVKAGSPMSREQADNTSANPNFMQSRGYQVNCQSCVVAYEARLRGYDVQAKANTPSNKAAYALSRKTELGWIDPATGDNPKLLRNDKVTTPKRCKTWMEETIQPGERYTFEHGWKGRRNAGHIISVDKDSKGALRFYDPQSGKTMQGADIDSYLSRTKLSTTINTYTDRGRITIPLAGMLRVDNLQINPQYSDGIMEAASK